MKRVSLALAAALVATPALAIEVKAGNWDLSFTGNVNAFVTFAACGDEADAAITGLSLACTKGEDEPNFFTIESGLLPNALVFTAKSRQANLDVSATIGFYPGQNNAGGVPLTNEDGAGALGSPGIDVRQGFLTFGDKSWGSVKVGRDLGIFGGEAILSDMTLLGVGSFGGARGANTTLGHIGTGYQYADWIPQVSYTTPSYSGLTLNVGILQGLNLSGDFTRHETPMAQAKVAYDLTGPVAGKIWAGGMFEQVKNAADDDVTGLGGELGVKVNTQGLGVVAYGFYGSGIGTTILGAGAIGPDDEERTSFGYWGQVTYQIGKLKPGISYGASHLQEADNEEDDTLLKKNATLTAGLYYSLTESLNLVAEYNKTWSENQGGDDVTDNVFSLGSIIFF